MKIKAKSAFNEPIMQCGVFFTNQWQEYDFSEGDVHHLVAYAGVDVEFIEDEKKSQKDEERKHEHKSEKKK